MLFLLGPCLARPRLASLAFGGRGSAIWVFLLRCKQTHDEIWCCRMPICNKLMSQHCLPMSWRSYRCAVPRRATAQRERLERLLERFALRLLEGLIFFKEILGVSWERDLFNCPTGDSFQQNLASLSFKAFSCLSVVDRAVQTPPAIVTMLAEWQSLLAPLVVAQKLLCGCESPCGVQGARECGTCPHISIFGIPRKGRYRKGGLRQRACAAGFPLSNATSCCKSQIEIAVPQKEALYSGRN